MKISTLLLSSAALLVAGSAFAADLPAKKMAPAAAPTGCSAFGAGYFQIPGGDTCIKFSGYVAYEGNYVNTSTTSGYGQGGEGRLIAETASNTDLGTLKTKIRMTAATSGTYATAGTTSGSFAVSRAYGELGGFRFGRDDSHADISGVGAGGTYAWNGGTGLGGGTGVGLWYKAAVGAATVEVGEENAVTDGLASASYQSNRPDMMVKASMPAGPASFVVMGISHSASDAANSGAQGSAGYAFLAQAQVQQGNYGVAVFGGVSQGALKYTGLNGSTQEDYYNGVYSKGQNFGVEGTAVLGAGTLAVFAGQSTSTDNFYSASAITKNYADIEYDFAVAKGMYVTPEFYTYGGTASSQTFYLTIHRDF